MSLDGSKSETDQIDIVIQAQAVDTPSIPVTKSFESLDEFESIFAILLMALSFREIDNPDFLSTLSDIVGDDEFSNFVTEQKNTAATPQQAAEKYDKYTSESLSEFSAMPASILTSGSPEALLHPTLVERMSRDPQVAQYVSVAFDAAEQAGIDPYIFANQLWQESRFDPRAAGPAREVNGVMVRARGIGQFIPSTGARYGLTTRADFEDPVKNIYASAEHVADLTERFGDQGLALVGYNGGSRAVTHLGDRYGPNISIAEWVGEMRQQNLDRGRGAAHLWRSETLNYVEVIDPRFWSEEMKEESRLATAKLEETSTTFNFNAACQNIGSPTDNAAQDCIVENKPMV